MKDGKVAHAAETPEALQYARESLRYCDETGKLFWTKKRGRSRVGDEAGNVGTNGHARVGLLGRYYQAHRVVWALCTGAWPSGFLDHRDCNTLNNRFSNLRPADKSVNALNVHTPRPGNRAGLRGVSLNPKGKYRARIFLRGKEIGLGVFDTAEEAHAAYLQAKQSEIGL